MSAKAISEQTGKEFLYKYICTSAAVQNRFRFANVTPETDFDRLAKEHPWLLTEVGPKTNAENLWSREYILRDMLLYASGKLSPL